jgi:hypothetical protein
VKMQKDPGFSSRFSALRQLIIFCVGISGIIYEEVHGEMARVSLLVVYAIMLGLVPVEAVVAAWLATGGTWVTRMMDRVGGKKNGNGTSPSPPPSEP